MTHINTLLREHQEADETFGALFKALHTFVDRTLERFFEDTPGMPHPVVALEKVRTSCRGEYHPKDGRMLEHCIVVDPFKCSNGEEAAEVLAHELVHAWQFAVQRLPERNYHNSEFHNRLGLMGIMSSGKRGHHVGYIEGDVWPLWLKENSDLLLAQFILPGTDEEKRQLLKYACPDCGFSFRTRRQDVNVICMVEDCAVPMEEVDE